MLGTHEFPATRSPGGHGPTAAAAPGDAPDLLSALACIPRGRPAIIDSAREVSFGELASETGRLSEELRRRGAGAESVVALCLPRGAGLVVSVMAVLAAGGAYLPLDPAYPADRLTGLMADSGARWLVTTAGLAGLASWPAGTDLVLIDGRADATPAAPATEAGPWARPGNLAYVVYTSGSTGAPKGVEVTRAGVAELLQSHEGAGVAAGTGRRVGWNASLSFDASVQQWVRLLRGDTLVVIGADTRADPAALAALITGRQLTDLDITPAHLDVLLDQLEASQPGWPMDTPLRLHVGGEAISPALWSRLAALESTGAIQAVNLYGPTECIVNSTAGWISDSRRPSLGLPLPGVRAYVLDDGMRPVADGEPGELYVGGPRLARGYRGRPDLTAERFLPDVVAGDGTRMYRTGDQVRRDTAGRLEYLGRLDQQVKIRGFRVEPGEIEYLLRETPGVTEAVVVFRDDLPSGPGLAAYCRAGNGIRPHVLHESLAGRLPDFMLPSAIVLLDRFPLNANGKVDRNRLPAPGASGAAKSAEYVPPEGHIERMLAEVWSSVLGIDQVSATDNFFQVGGHSILAIRVVARLKREAMVTIPMEAVFDHPRLRDLAAYVDETLTRTASLHRHGRG